jgi:hypothetical protein
VERGLGIYDYLALVPVIEGAGGFITDWRGQALTMESKGEVIAAGDRRSWTRRSQRSAPEGRYSPLQDAGFLAGEVSVRMAESRAKAAPRQGKSA